MGSSVARCVAGLVAIGLAGACGDERAYVEPRHRLVDRAPRSIGTPVRPPAATVDDERRLVLFAYPEAQVVVMDEERVDREGRLNRRASLPRALRGADRVLLKPSVRIGESWEAYPAFAARVDARRYGSYVDVELELGRELGSAMVGLDVEAMALPESAERSFETPAVPIPPRDSHPRLEFGMALLDAPWQQRGVEFSVHVCAAGACEEAFREAVETAMPEDRRWLDRAVDLGAHAGREVSFRFQTRAASGAAGADAVALPVWSNPTVFARATRRPEQLGLILISIDTLRADHLPSYGYARDTAPFIREAFEHQGTVVESAVAAAATTGPAHATIFTGLQPSAHGCGSEGTSLRR
jgi:hypothetical protein